MSASPHPLEVDGQTVKARLDGGDPIVMLDCRERDEHALVQIAGARLLPMTELAERLAELDEARHSELVVFCHHGMRSLQVAGWLRQRGFSRVSSLAGGIDRWSREIDPTLPRY